MKQFRTNLADKLDAMASEGTCQVFEQPNEISISRLRSPDAIEVADLLDQLGWETWVEYEAGVLDRPYSLTPAFEPYKISARKAVQERGVAYALTATGLKGLLLSDSSFCCIRAHGAEQVFDTHSTRFCDWDGASEFHPVHVDIDPRAYCRDLSGSRTVPDNLDLWLLKTGQSPDISNKMVRSWAQLSSRELLKALASELDADLSLVFRGQPNTTVRNINTINSLDDEVFSDLQKLAHWVFENPREVETKHALINAELARGKLDYSNPAEFMDENLRPALQGARTAHQLGLTKLSSDALKALSELRRSVSEETTRLSDTGRQLATAVAGTVFTGIGVLAAKLTIASKSDLFGTLTVGIGFALLMYTVSVVWTGWTYMNLQGEMRAAWRTRLYRYITDADYYELVTKPTRQAERNFKKLAGFASLLGVGLLFAIVLLSWEDLRTTTIDPFFEWLQSSEQTDPVLPKVDAPAQEQSVAPADP